MSVRTDYAANDKERGSNNAAQTWTSDGRMFEREFEVFEQQNEKNEIFNNLRTLILFYFMYLKNDVLFYFLLCYRC